MAAILKNGRHIGILSGWRLFFKKVDLKEYLCQMSCLHHQVKYSGVILQLSAPLQGLLHGTMTLITANCTHRVSLHIRPGIAAIFNGKHAETFFVWTSCSRPAKWWPGLESQCSSNQEIKRPCVFKWKCAAYPGDVWQLEWTRPPYQLIAIE